jgi:hypothetical protein
MACREISSPGARPVRATLNFLLHPFIVPVVEARDFDDEELLASMAQHKFLVAVIA